MSKFVRQSLLTILVVLMCLGIVVPGVFAMENNDDVEELYFEFAKRVSYTLIID